ncbi:MAG: hypothetical protein ACRDSR_08350 [Pseudonocardiaceae bacterium]
MLKLDDESSYLETRHFSFLAVTSYAQSASGDERHPMGLTYRLEAGVIRWYGTPSSRSSPLYLRQNTVLSPSEGQLASWEPTTDDKMALPTVELGIMGNAQIPLEEGLDFMAIAVNPRDFMYHWNGSDRIYLSDVETLAEEEDKLFHGRSPDGELRERHSFFRF